jgi:hypothetical protein
VLPGVFGSSDMLVLAVVVVSFGLGRREHGWRRMRASRPDAGRGCRLSGHRHEHDGRRWILRDGGGCLCRGRRLRYGTRAGGQVASQSGGRDADGKCDGGGSHHDGDRSPGRDLLGRAHVRAPAIGVRATVR